MITTALIIVTASLAIAQAVALSNPAFVFGMNATSRIGERWERIHKAKTSCPEDHLVIHILLYAQLATIAMLLCNVTTTAEQTGLAVVSMIVSSIAVALVCKWMVTISATVVLARSATEELSEEKMVVLRKVVGEKNGWGMASVVIMSGMNVVTVMLTTAMLMYRMGRERRVLGGRRGVGDVMVQKLMRKGDQREESK